MEQVDCSDMDQACDSYTKRIATLQAQLEAVRREREEYKGDWQVMQGFLKEFKCMPSMMASKADILQAALDAERARARTAAQLVIDTIGSCGGPENVEDAVGRLAEKWKTQVENIEYYQSQLAARSEEVAKLKNASDAAELQRREREKCRELLNAEVLHNGTLESQLTQLQALVRELVDAVDEAPLDSIPAEVWKAAYQVKASLDPAPVEEQTETMLEQICQKGGDGE